MVKKKIKQIRLFLKFPINFDKVWNFLLIHTHKLIDFTDTNIYGHDFT